MSVRADSALHERKVPSLLEEACDGNEGRAKKRPLATRPSLRDATLAGH